IPRQRRRVARTIAAAAACLLLASCRVDTVTSLSVEANGSGTVSVTVTADADVYKAAPTLKTDVRNDDLTAAGWKMKGPEETKEGGLTVTFTHGFDTPAEATTLLGQVNGTRGPLKGLVLQRSGKNSNSTFTLTGRLEVNGGLQAFADDAALKLLGGAPYANQVKNSGLDLGKAVGIDFTAEMPGTVVSTTGTATGSVITWRVPTDGTPTDIATTTNNVDIASNVARFFKWIVAFLLVVWVLGTVALLGLIVSRRGRRTPRL
ncbi:MAG: hypothetical protein RJA47_771, partial [Actinomycetota bacterium]